MVDFRCDGTDNYCSRTVLEISMKMECDYLYGWIKTPTYAKISPKMVNPRDIAGNAEEGEPRDIAGNAEEGEPRDIAGNIAGKKSHRYTGMLLGL